ncbi:DUF1566 domain-containing protein [Caldichromatium japonicum]|nr:DUF1566 domain-containing protein [Caldichromatium japonicum]
MPNRHERVSTGIAVLNHIGRCVLWMIALWAGAEVRSQEIPPANDACFKGLAETAPSTEFTQLEGGAVVRHERTGLEWQRCALGQQWDAASKTCAGRPTVHTWKEAVKQAEQTGDGWRLPTGDELMTIVERCHDGPAINPQVFPNTPGVLFWSSSVDTGGVGRVWAVSFFTGQPFRVGTAQNGRVRLVRGTIQGP